jgi:hypothetical protein
MRFITSNDIDTWADTIDCKYHLPHLVRKLILATINNDTIKKLQFDYGEDVLIGGFDGELISESENMFVPLGESVWEFGTSNSKKKKADDDYEKRKENPLGKIPGETTYINVNGKKYRDKKRWTKEKNDEGFWKYVRYFDALDIEQWLELAPNVELWLAEKLKKPTLGIYTIENYWKRWSENKSIKIVPEILLGHSRLNEIEKIKSFLTNDEKVFYIKSITSDEAMAFPLAVIKQLENTEGDNIIVIDNRDSFNQYTQTDKPLIILSKFKIESIDLSGAIQRGHKVIIPLSLSDEINVSEKIQLPIVSRESFEKGLEKMGIDSEQTRILTKNSGRNISVLKRLLKFDDSIKPKYLQSIDIIDVIPVLFINRFSENLNGDKEVIEKLSGKSSAEYIQFLRILVTLEDSPVYYIGGVWRLVSPTDTWLYFAKYITQQHLEDFKGICLEVLCEISHKYTLPIEARGNYYQTPQNRTKYSSKLREGLSESLAVISVFGNDYGINSIPNVPLYINNIVQELLEMDITVWRSLSSNLQLLAEASPTIFLNNLERIIKDKSISAYFEIEKGFMNESNDLAPLLWCLDIIAWFPEHLMRVSTFLCEIILVSPESFPTSNTPLSNLKNIYRTWYPQTNTNVEDRKKILEILIKKYPDTLYVLLYSCVGNNQDTAFRTPRPKWRLFSEIKEIRVTQRDVDYMRNFCLDNVIEISKDNMERILLLIDLLDQMEWNKIDIALKTIETGLQSNEENKGKVFHKFRKFIGNHRSSSTTRLVLSQDILEKIEQTAIKFKPENDILNDSYLFEERHPKFIEGKQGSDFEEILSRRLIFINKVLEQYEISKIYELSTKIEHPYLYGNALALSKKLTEENKCTTYKLVESTDKNLLSLVREFIRTSENLTNLQTQITVLNHMIESDLSSQGINVFLNSLRVSVDLWKFIYDLQNEEVEKLYWKSQQCYLDADSKEGLFYALDKLKQYDKPITLLNTLGWGTYIHKNILTSEEVLTILENISLIDFADTSNFDHDHFKYLLDFLYSKTDYDIERAAKIEMKFIFVFTGGGSRRPKPKNLYKLMSQKPDEYFGILSQVYLPEKDELREAELQKVKDNPNYQEIIKAGRGIMDSFNLIPSLQEDGSMNSDQFKEWIREVRLLAAENHRVEITDRCIGKLLAKYPINMKDGKGFSVEIYDVIEKINSIEIKDSFRVQLLNNSRFTGRGAFEGGNIERLNGDYFNSLTEETKFTHPNISLVFKGLKEEYLSRAKWQDENALLRSLE